MDMGYQRANLTWPLDPLVFVSEMDINDLEWKGWLKITQWIKGFGEHPISSSKCTVESFIDIPLHSKKDKLISQQREIENITWT